MFLCNKNKAFSQHGLLLGFVLRRHPKPSQVLSMAVVEKQGGTHHDWEVMYGACTRPLLLNSIRLILTPFQITIGLAVTRVTEEKEINANSTQKC